MRANNKDADQTTHIYRLVCAFFVRIYKKIRSSRIDVQIIVKKMKKNGCFSMRYNMILKYISVASLTTKLF